MSGFMDKAKEMAEGAVDKAKDLGEEALEKASELGGDAVEKAKGLIDRGSDETPPETPGESGAA